MLKKNDNLSETTSSDVSENTNEIINNEHINSEYDNDITNYINNTYNKTNNLKKDHIKIKDLYTNYKDSYIYKSYDIKKKNILTYKLFIDIIQNIYGKQIYHNSHKTLIISGLIKK